MVFFVLKLKGTQFLSLRPCRGHLVWNFMCLSLERFVSCFSSQFYFLFLPHPVSVLQLFQLLLLAAAINLSLLCTFSLSLKCCIYAILNTGDSSAFLFSWHTKSAYFIPRPSSSSVWVPFLTRIQSILHRRLLGNLFLEFDFSKRVCFRLVFLFFWAIFLIPEMNVRIEFTDRLSWLLA